MRRALRDAGGTRDTDPIGLDTPSDSSDFDYDVYKSETDSNISLGEPINTAENKPKNSDSEGDDNNDPDSGDGGVSLPVEKDTGSSLPDAQNTDS